MPERHYPTNRAAVAAEGLSVALKRASMESIIQRGDGQPERMIHEIEKLKVVDLRHELKSYGLGSKSYSKLRKADLVAMVFEHRKSKLVD
jgi:hypothetical protein